ncbi:MAG TPA: ABC transporter permease [Trebonia sp.]|jgi:ABC-2 type transport system permease protein|nr:ABC transporter permease [Trebonia sp.]
MSVATRASAAASAGAAPRRSALGQLARVELKLFLREKVGPVWGIGLPMLLLVIFGSIPAFKKELPGSGGLTTLDTYVPILILLSLGLLSLVAMPLTIVNYRERGVLRRLRTTPAGPVRVLAAQLIVYLGMAIVTVALIVAVGRLAYGVPLPRQFGAWLLSLVFAVAALLAMGLFVAAVGPNPRAAGAIGSLLFYPLMFFSGLWLPIPAMPAVLQHIAHATPLGAAWEGFQQAILGHWPPVLGLVAMAAWAVVFALAAARFFRWD